MSDSYTALRDRLLDEMGKATHELRAVVDTANAEQRDLTPDEQEKFGKINADLDQLESRIGDLNKRIRSDRQTDEYRHDVEPFVRPEGRGDHGLPENSLEKRVIDFFQGKGPNKLDIDLRGLKVERDGGRNVVREYRTGLVEGTASAGGATVPTSFRAVLYQHLIQTSAVRQTRATILTTDSGEALLLPKTTAHPASGTIVSEAAAINENDPTFGQGTLNAYKYANLVQVSSELETDTAVDLLGYLAMAMGRALGIGAGADYVTGSGTSKPQGFLVGVGAATGTVVTGGTGQSGVPTYAELEHVFDSIIPPYQRDAEWIMSQFTVSKLRQIVDTLGRPLWVPSLSGDMPNTLFGHPYYIDPAMPNAGTSATSIAFGDFSTYFIRDVNGLRFERSVDYAFNTDLLTYRAILRTDGRLLDLTAPIGVYKGGTA